MNAFLVRDRWDRRARRLHEIATVAVRYGLAVQLRKLPGERMHRWLRGSAPQDIAELATPVRLRLALAELGTTFIKLGQMLSTRADLVGEDVARELAQLQTDAPPDPPGVVEKTITSELGRTPATLFASFQPTPYASASIAQVHCARLHSGESVVVKVQKEGIERQVETDLSILADLARLAEDHVAELKPYHPVGVVEQLAKTIRGELDFLRELRNLQTFRRNFAAEETVHFPVPYPDLCTRRVLTMERLEGVLLTQLRPIPGPSTDTDEFVRRGANMYLQMIFRDSFYHADPHPGNLMLLPDGVVGVLDCGMVQRLDDDLRETIEDLLLAIVRGDARSVTDAVWDLCTPSSAAVRQRLHSDLTELLADYTSRAVAEVDVGALLNSLADVIHRNRLFLPPGASLLLRMLAELDGTAKRLNPSFSLVELMQPYAEEAARRRFAPRSLRRRLQRSAREWDRLLRSIPADLNDVLQRARGGTLSVHLEHRRLDAVVNRLVLGLLTSSLLLGSTLLWSMHAKPLLGSVSVLGAVGYAIALIMGLRLLRAVSRSERPRGNA